MKIQESVQCTVERNDPGCCAEIQRFLRERKQRREDRTRYDITLCSMRAELARKTREIIELQQDNLEKDKVIVQMRLRRKTLQSGVVRLDKPCEPLIARPQRKVSAVHNSPRHLYAKTLDDLYKASPLRDPFWTTEESGILGCEVLKALQQTREFVPLLQPVKDWCQAHARVWVWLTHAFDLTPWPCRPTQKLIQAAISRLIQQRECVKKVLCQLHYQELKVMNRFAQVSQQPENQCKTLYQQLQHYEQQKHTWALETSHMIQTLTEVKLDLARNTEHLHMCKEDRDMRDAQGKSYRDQVHALQSLLADTVEELNRTRCQLEADGQEKKHTQDIKESFLALQEKFHTQTQHLQSQNLSLHQTLQDFRHQHSIQRCSVAKYLELNRFSVPCVKIRLTQLTPVKSWRSSTSWNRSPLQPLSFKLPLCPCLKTTELILHFNPFQDPSLPLVTKPQHTSLSSKNFSPLTSQLVSWGPQPTFHSPLHSPHRFTVTPLFLLARVFSPHAKAEISSSSPSPHEDLRCLKEGIPGENIISSPPVVPITHSTPQVSHHSTPPTAQNTKLSLYKTRVICHFSHSTPYQGDFFHSSPQHHSVHLNDATTQTTHSTHVSNPSPSHKKKTFIWPFSAKPKTNHPSISPPFLHNNTVSPSQPSYISVPPQKAAKGSNRWTQRNFKQPQTYSHKNQNIFFTHTPKPFSLHHYNANSLTLTPSTPPSRHQRHLDSTPLHSTHPIQATSPKPHTLTSTTHFSSPHDNTPMHSNPRLRQTSSTLIPQLPFNSLASFTPSLPSSPSHTSRRKTWPAVKQSIPLLKKKIGDAQSMRFHPSRRNSSSQHSYETLAQTKVNQLPSPHTHNPAPSFSPTHGPTTPEKKETCTRESHTITQVLPPQTSRYQGQKASIHTAFDSLHDTPVLHPRSATVPQNHSVSLHLAVRPGKDYFHRPALPTTAQKHTIGESPKKTSDIYLRDSQENIWKDSQENNLRDSPKNFLKIFPKKALKKVLDNNLRDSSENISRDSSENISRDSSENISRDSSENISRDSSENHLRDSQQNIWKDLQESDLRDSQENDLRDSQENFLKDFPKKALKKALGNNLRDSSENNLRDSQENIWKDPKENNLRDSPVNFLSDPPKKAPKKALGNILRNPLKKAPDNILRDSQGNIWKDPKENNLRDSPVNFLSDLPKKAPKKALDNTLRDPPKKALKKASDNILRDSQDNTLRDPPKKALKKAPDNILRDSQGNIWKDPKENNLRDSPVNFLSDLPKKAPKKALDNTLRDPPKKALKKASDNILRDSQDNTLRDPPKKALKKAPDNNSRDSSENHLRDSSENILRDSSENILRDSSENILRDSSENISRDSSENILRDSSENILRDSSENISRDSSENISRDSSENISRDSSENVSRESSENHLRDSQENFLKDFTKKALRKALDNDLRDSQGNVFRNSSENFLRDPSENNLRDSPENFLSDPPKKSLKKSPDNILRDFPKKALKKTLDNILRDFPKKALKKTLDNNLRDSLENRLKDSSENNLKDSQENIWKDPKEHNLKDSPVNFLRDFPKKALKKTPDNILRDPPKKAPDNILGDSSENNLRDSPENFLSDPPKRTPDNNLRDSSENLLRYSSENLLRYSSENLLRYSSENLLRISSENLLRDSWKKDVKKSLKNSLRTSGKKNVKILRRWSFAENQDGDLENSFGRKRFVMEFSDSPTTALRQKKISGETSELLYLIGRTYDKICCMERVQQSHLETMLRDCERAQMQLQRQADFNLRVLQDQYKQMVNCSEKAYAEQKVLLEEKLFIGSPKLLGHPKERRNEAFYPQDGWLQGKEELMALIKRNEKHHTKQLKQIWKALRPLRCWLQGSSKQDGEKDTGKTNGRGGSTPKSPHDAHLIEEALANTLTAMKRSFESKIHFLEIQLQKSLQGDTAQDHTLKLKETVEPPLHAMEPFKAERDPQSSLSPVTCEKAPIKDMALHVGGDLSEEVPDKSPWVAPMQGQAEANFFFHPKRLGCSRFPDVLDDVHSTRGRRRRNQPIALSSRWSGGALPWLLKTRNEAQPDCRNMLKDLVLLRRTVHATCVEQQTKPYMTF